jgi:PD-(D/E)XK nuclease superfamily protein
MQARLARLNLRGVSAMNRNDERLMLIHETQLLSYLKLSGKRLGLLINFHVLRLKDGYKRNRKWALNARSLRSLR